jgi:hypothetical protein
MAVMPPAYCCGTIGNSSRPHHVALVIVCDLDLNSFVLT